jgi:hypothetical protein
MNTSELRAGFYRLTHDVKNPTPDKRKVRDWTAACLWEKGTVLCAAERYYGVKAHGFLTLELVGHRYRHDCIGPGNETAYAALIEAFEPIAEDYDCLMHRLDTSADVLLDALHRMHRVSLADLAEAQAFAHREYDAQDHANGHHKDNAIATCPKCVAENVTDNRRGI